MSTKDLAVELAEKAWQSVRTWDVGGKIVIETIATAMRPHLSKLLDPAILASELHVHLYNKGENRERIIRDYLTAHPIAPAPKMFNFTDWQDWLYRANVQADDDVVLETRRFFSSPPTPAERVTLDATAADEKLKDRIAFAATIRRETLEDLQRELREVHWSAAGQGAANNIIARISAKLSCEPTPTPEPAKSFEHGNAYDQFAPAVGESEANVPVDMHNWTRSLGGFRCKKCNAFAETESMPDSKCPGEPAKATSEEVGKMREQKLYERIAELEAAAKAEWEGRQRHAAILAGMCANENWSGFDAMAKRAIEATDALAAAEKGVKPESRT